MQPEIEPAYTLIKQTREYTIELIEDFTPEEWFAMPEGITNLAWQMGHLAMVEFRLCLERLRGLQPDDRDMIGKQFMRRYGRGTTAEPASDEQPTVEEIRATFDCIHVAVLEELPRYEGNDLTEPLLNPHPKFDTRLAALYFCAQHEMLHAGQIGMLRRLLGKQPLR